MKATGCVLKCFFIFVINTLINYLDSIIFLFNLKHFQEML